ncbi:MAG: hypothetical protein ACJAVR_003815 [Paracoccaceae bacterium]|jgi:hypothetical protein
MPILSANIASLFAQTISGISPAPVSKSVHWDVMPMPSRVAGAAAAPVVTSATTDAASAKIGFLAEVFNLASYSTHNLALKLW